MFPKNSNFKISEYVVKQDSTRSKSSVVKPKINLCLGFRTFAYGCIGSMLVFSKYFIFSLAVHPAMYLLQYGFVVVDHAWL